MNPIYIWTGVYYNSESMLRAISQWLWNFQMESALPLAEMRVSAWCEID